MRNAIENSACTEHAATPMAAFVCTLLNDVPTHKVLIKLKYFCKKHENDTNLE